MRRGPSAGVNKIAVLGELRGPAWGNLVVTRYISLSSPRCANSPDSEFLNNGSDTLGSAPVPQRHGCCLAGPAAGQSTFHFFFQALDVAADQRVGAHGQRDGTLGIFPDRKARHAEESCFLLNAARIGDHDGGAAL